MDPDVLVLFQSVVLPLFICVVLPLGIVWISARSRREEQKARMELMTKCVENGVELDPKLLADLNAPEKKHSRLSVKRSLLRQLTVGIICLLAGLGLGIIVWTEFPSFDGGFAYGTVILFAVGIGLSVSFFVGRRMLAAEIRREEETAGR